MNTLQPSPEPIGIFVLAAAGSWSGTVEAQGPDHIRVRFQPGVGQDAPSLTVGERVECSLVDGSRRHNSTGKVLKQSDSVAWIQVPATWTQREQRAAQRAAVGFSVTYDYLGETYVGRCLNVSVGGMRLRVPSPPAESSRLRVKFVLPGETRAVSTEAQVIRLSDSCEEKQQYEVGLKFSGIVPELGAYLATVLHVQSAP